MTATGETTTIGTLLRGEHHRGHVGYVELFFDLVFVFAVTQLSHALLAHPTPAGFAGTALLLLAVWWVWIYTAWVTNWLDPDRTPVRLLMFALMAAGLVMSAAIPTAFAEGGLAFAASYAGMQLGRTVFFRWAVRAGPDTLVRNFERIAIWFGAASALWIAGGLASPATRPAWWLAALAVDVAGPWMRFRVPGLGRASVADWSIDGSHLAERCALFVIIALGESLLVTGATFADMPRAPATTAAFALAVAGSVLMWWIYFDTGATRAAQRIRTSVEPGRQGRLAYTYLHVPIVAGIILSAVADERVLMHPDHADTAGVVAIVGAPMLFVLGTALFKWATNDRRWPPLSHLAGLVLLAVVAAVGPAAHWSALALSAATVAILALVALWEGRALRAA